MAIETDQFRREDIYSLFIATRIINFLKGLRLSESTDLDTLMDRSWPEDRTRIGFELLRLLRETNRLYFWTAQGLRENKKFKPEIFFHVLRQAGTIGCQNGQRITVGTWRSEGKAVQGSMFQVQRFNAFPTLNIGFKQKNSVES